jgi:hypothetical protein
MKEYRPRVSSHTGFQPLKEVWVGDCYPAAFADAVDSKHKELFYKITESTQRDLDQLVKKIQEFDIVVRRPEFNDISTFLDDRDKLIKPPITPRDWAITLDDTLYITPQYPDSFTAFESTINLYKNNNQKVRILDRTINEPMCYMVFPAVVRVGDDLFVDIPLESNILEIIHPVLEELSTKYRVHVTRNGDHSDGVFCPVAAGQIFSTHYRQKYKSTFPEWDVFFLTDTTALRDNNHNGKWWLPGIDYPQFGEEVFSQWIGDSRETVFEVNMLVIDEHNIICIAEDDLACKKLESLGITPHVVDFKTRGFWDGGVHCLTLDIHRAGDKINYWPGLRTRNGIYYHE